MPRMHVEQPLRAGATLILEGDPARYLGKVLRLTPGDTVSLFNSDDGEFVATIVAMRKSSVEFTVGDSIENRSESPLKTHLVQGISRGDRMDFVVQKATELGVKRITPVLTQHGVVKLDGKRAARRREHWQGVATSACEQCGRVRPPLVDDVVSLNAWFGARPRAADVDLILRPDAATALTGVVAPTTKLCLLVGPEGGFSAAEYADATAAGFDAVSMGPRILRTETAAVAALAIAQAAWGDLGN